MADNLYVHFPFCRGKCSYCSLHSRGGSSAEERAAYVSAVALAVSSRPERRWKTAYFGGGTPALCDLAPALAAVEADEFTVELHPLDVTDGLVAKLADAGVNRVSMGVQSLDDAILGHMGRGYSFEDAERAFAAVKKRIDNAGIDLIVGYPGETAAILPRHSRLADWGLRHCSVYALQNERGLAGAVDDDTAMDRIAETAAFLEGLGLSRYEISNYAAPGFECRHNLAVWRGEDYAGIGEGACGREGLLRTTGRRSRGGSPFEVRTEEVSPETDAKERRIFRLRTREGLDASGFPEWEEPLSRFAAEGLLERRGRELYVLTPRGAEVCDAILAGLA